MRRNPVHEWRKAMERRTAWTDASATRPVTPQHSEDAYVPVAPGELPAWLRRTRDVTPSTSMLSQNAETILVLQRANKLLMQRFGITWADAASVIFAEAGRRGASPTALARVLTSGLRRDAKGATS